MVHMLAHERRHGRDLHAQAVRNLTGTGLHMHSSLWDAAPARSFSDDTDAGAASGCPELAYHYIGGLIDHAPCRSAA